MPVDILMMGPMRPIEQQLEPEFTLHRLWQHADRPRFFADKGAAIRGIVAYSGAALVDAEVLGALPNVQIIVNMGVGYESVDIGLAKDRGIAVTNAGSVNAVDVAEHAFGLILAVGRGIAAGDRYVRAGQWTAKGRMGMTHRVTGRTLGILGMGHIGLQIAKRAAAFDMPVFYHNRHRRLDSAHAYVESAPELARIADVLMVATPGGEGTRHLVDRQVLDALGPDGIVVNIARGSVIDEKALVEALVAGRLAGAGLDVFEDEPRVPQALLDLPNVVVQPHQSGATFEGVKAAVDVLVDNLRNFFAGKPISNRVV